MTEIHDFSGQPRRREEQRNSDGSRTKQQSAECGDMYPDEKITQKNLCFCFKMKTWARKYKKCD